MSAIDYTRVNFQDYPNTSTPITAEILNKLDKGIYDLDIALTQFISAHQTYSKNISWYGTSSTAASTIAKTATTSDSKFALTTGAKVSIKFTYDNTASAPTLNVDSTGAKGIKAYGTTAPTSWWQAGDVVTFTYDGTNWIMGATEGQISQINSELADVNSRITIGSPTAVYDGDGGITIATSQTLWTATANGFIIASPVVKNGYGDFKIGNTYIRYYNNSTNEIRNTICGFIKKGETFRIIPQSGSGVRADIGVTFIPLL